MAPLSLGKLRKKSVSEIPTKPRSKINRFNGLTEEEIQQNSPPLPDYLKLNLDLVFVGINPSLTAAYRGRYYAGPGNHFYKLLHESGLVPRFVNSQEDEQLVNFGIGLTNIVDRATRSSADLSRAEIKQGSIIVERKLREYKPKIAVFNGRCIYDVYANKTGKSDFYFGLQPERIGETAVWVVPSSSARCSNFPRMIDKLQFYLSLKKYLSFLKGEISDVDVREFYFPAKSRENTKNASPFFKGKIAGKEIRNVGNSSISDQEIGCVNNEFVIKEIRSQHGIEKFEYDAKSSRKIDDDSVTKSKSSGINFNSENSRNDKNVANKFELGKNVKPACKKRNFRNVPSESPVKQRENSSDFVSLIKQRIEAKKRKAEDLENTRENF